MSTGEHSTACAPASKTIYYWQPTSVAATTWTLNRVDDRHHFNSCFRGKIMILMQDNYFLFRTMIFWVFNRVLLPRFIFYRQQRYHIRSKVVYISIWFLKMSQMSLYYDNISYKNIIIQNYQLILHLWSTLIFFPAIHLCYFVRYIFRTPNETFLLWK